MNTIQFYKRVRKVNFIFIKVYTTVIFFIAGYIWSMMDFINNFAVYLHELGHAVFSFGGKIVGYCTYVNVDWPIGAMGSMLFQHIFAGVLAYFVTKAWDSLGAFGVGWSVFITVNVFNRYEGQFSYDMIDWTPAWYPVTVLCTLAVMGLYVLSLWQTTHAH
jgi:hypothetical protein